MLKPLSFSKMCASGRGGLRDAGRHSGRGGGPRERVEAVTGVEGPAAGAGARPDGGGAPFLVCTQGCRSARSPSCEDLNKMIYIKCLEQCLASGESARETFVFILNYPV